MDYLLDTHTLLWYLADNPKISKEAKSIINDTSNGIYVSIAGFWEIAIKLSIGKITIQEPLSDIYNKTKYIGIAVLPLSDSAIFRIETLPLHHRDPFDRIIIATAETSKLSVISKDDRFELYGINRVW